MNFHSGSRTPLSGVLSGLAVAATVLAAAPLAGVLLVVAYDMIHWEDIKRTIRATRGDAAVLLLTFLSTLLRGRSFSAPRLSSRRTCCGGCAIIPIRSTC